MIWKARRYKGLDFTDSIQVASQVSNWFSYIIQNAEYWVNLRTQSTERANYHGWYSSNTLAWPRLFTFTWKVIGTKKQDRHNWLSLLTNAIKPEWNPDTTNRGFYDLQRQDDWWNERTCKAKVYSMVKPTNWLDDPIIEYNFELYSETEKVYSPTVQTITWNLASFGGMTLSTTLPTTSWNYTWAIPLTNAGNRYAPLKIQIVWTCTNPQIINVTNGNKYRINWITTNLILDNRNLTNDPTQLFIVSDSGTNIKSQRRSWADIFLDPWLNKIAIITDNPNETATVYITFRNTYI